MELTPSERTNMDRTNMDRYEVIKTPQGHSWEGEFECAVLDRENFGFAVAWCFTRESALHICAALNGFNAMIAAVKQ